MDLNNLIKDYCRENKVVIEFDNNEQFRRINSLFDIILNPHSNINGGLVTFTVVTDELGTATRRFTTFKHSSSYKDYIKLTADELFTLALPCKSILEYIK